MPRTGFILASSSPRRIEMLNAQGYSFKVVTPNAPEFSLSAKGAADVALKNSVIKAEVVAGKYPDEIILSADTIVVLDGKIMGKPGNKRESLEMLLKLNNKIHSVITAYTIAIKKNGRTKIIEKKAVESFVTFGDFSDKEYENYVRTGEPGDKAGAYGIQGIGARFIKDINGSYSNVVGLPIFEVMQGLKKAGVQYPWK